MESMRTRDDVLQAVKESGILRSMQQERASDLSDTSIGKSKLGKLQVTHRPSPD